MWPAQAGCPEPRGHWVPRAGWVLPSGPRLSCSHGTEPPGSRGTWLLTGGLGVPGMRAGVSEGLESSWGSRWGRLWGSWCRGVGAAAKGSPWCLAGGTRADGAPPHPSLPQPHGTFPGALLCRLPQRGLRQVSQGRVWGVVSNIPGRDTSLLTPVFPFGQ